VLEDPPGNPGAVAADVKSFRRREGHAAVT